MSHKPHPMGLGGCEATPGSTDHSPGVRKATPGAKRRGKGLRRELGRLGLPAAGRAVPDATAGNGQGIESGASVSPPCVLSPPVLTPALPPSSRSRRRGPAWSSGRHSWPPGCRSSVPPVPRMPAPCPRSGSSSGTWRPAPPSSRRSWRGKRLPSITWSR